MLYIFIDLSDFFYLYAIALKKERKKMHMINPSNLLVMNVTNNINNVQQRVLLSSQQPKYFLVQLWASNFGMKPDSARCTELTVI